MKRIRRCISLLGIACLLAFGSVGDTQVPGNVVPPLFLRDRLDIAVLHNVISSQSQEIEAVFASSPATIGIRFRPLFATSLSRLYTGNFQVDRALLLGTSSSPNLARSGLGSGVSNFGYLHVMGSGPSMPPDQLFVGRASSSSPGQQVTTKISSRSQLELLKFVLEGLAGQGQCPELATLSDWFDSHSEISIRGFEIHQWAAEFQLDLYCESSNRSTQPALTRSIQAVYTGFDSFDQVVVK